VWLNFSARGDTSSGLTRLRMVPRARLLVLTLAGAAGWVQRAAAQTPELPPVVVYAPSPCLACIDWADYLRKHGPFEPHRLPLEEMEYTTMPAVAAKLESRWQAIRDEGEPQKIMAAPIVAAHREAMLVEMNVRR